MHRNVNFSAFWCHWQALVRLHAYAFTWQILLRILFALKFKTPRNKFCADENSKNWNDAIRNPKILLILWLKVYEKQRLLLPAKTYLMLLKNFLWFSVLLFQEEKSEMGSCCTKKCCDSDADGAPMSPPSYYQTPYMKPPSIYPSSGSSFSIRPLTPEKSQTVTAISTINPTKEKVTS